MNRNDIDIFEKLSGQLISIYEEISILSKKNPNDAVNKFKLKFINNAITNANEFLSDDYLPFDSFKAFEEDDIPQNGDIVFILSQYLQCFEKMRADNVVLKHGYWCWKIEAKKDEKAGEDEDKDGKFIFKKTVKPKKLRD